MDTATLSGHVASTSGAKISGAIVEVVDTDHGTRIRTRTNNSGLYVFPQVAPGHYLVLVSAPGFKTLQFTRLAVSPLDVLDKNFNLEAGPESESVTLLANGTSVDSSGAVSTVVDPTLVRELPLNGRSFQTLLQLTPGIGITPTSFSNLGQFSTNGQKTDANYFIVDGVSANFGISFSANLGQSAGGSLPALTAFGGTNSLISTDDVQQFAILTSSFSPEFGRTPGAQVSVVSRSGTNEIHGGLFDYLRNDAFDANDWFANRQHLRRAVLRQNDFGGTLGGPLQQNRTFFFVSYEGLRLRQPTMGQSDVPSLAARSSAAVAIKPFFNAYPLPNGADEGNGLAQASYAFSNPLRLDAVSLRLDHHFRESVAIFGRYNLSTSDQKQRGADITSLNSITDLHAALYALTFGSTWRITPHFINDTRLNWSRSSASFDIAIDGFGGAVPFAPGIAIPSPFGKQDSFFQFVPALGVQHSGLEVGRNVMNLQSQINFTNNSIWDMHAHSLKAGIDLRSLKPRTESPAYIEQILFADINAALRGTTLFSIVEASTPVQSTFSNVSLFVQDTWRPIIGLNTTYGVRWDFNPAPTGRGNNGLKPFAVQGLNNLPALSLAPLGSPLYRAAVNALAPRFGLAYGLRKSASTATVIRGGAGVFYDFTNGEVGNAFSGLFFPFSAIKVLNGVSFPLSPNNAAPPSVTSTVPFGPIAAFPTVLKLPYTYQWNVSIEQSLGSSQTLTTGYVGSSGHNLLRTEEYLGGEAGVPPSFEQLLLTNNGGYSNYNALQTQFRRRASRGLDIVASYTYSHSLDNVSTDTASAGIPARFVNPRIDYGPSDFDIRHVGTVGLALFVPTANQSPIAKLLLSDWAIDPIFVFHSPPTINVVISRDIGFGTYPFRPDLIRGIPAYIGDQNVPGGVRINPAALTVPLAPRQGGLERNHFRGFRLFQTDIAVRRTFYLRNKVNVKIGLEAFNLFNHPNFAPESGQFGLVDPTGSFLLNRGFGLSSSLLGNGLQTEGPGSGFSPLYQIGQPRSMQASLKLEF
jgi:hypothetical protein